MILFQLVRLIIRLFVFLNHTHKEEHTTPHTEGNDTISGDMTNLSDSFIDIF